MTERPEIVCLCGSAGFMHEMRTANRELTCTRVIVLAPSEADEAPTPARRREIPYARPAGEPVSLH